MKAKSRDVLDMPDKVSQSIECQTEARIGNSSTCPFQTRWQIRFLFEVGAILFHSYITAGLHASNSSNVGGVGFISSCGE